MTRIKKQETKFLETNQGMNIKIHQVRILPRKDTATLVLGCRQHQQFDFNLQESFPMQNVLIIFLKTFNRLVNI